jgi:hypothetical protein
MSMSLAWKGLGKNSMGLLRALKASYYPRPGSGPTPRAADGGSLRDLRVFSTPQQFSGLESVFSPAAANASRWAAKNLGKIIGNDNGR